MNPSNTYPKISLNGHFKRPRVALTIGGSDPTGGAGIQADLKTFQQFGVHGLSVVTAVTAQHTHGVVSTNPVISDVVEAQLYTLSQDITIDAIKIGMLTTADVVSVVSNFVEEHNVPTVLDPVLSSSNGICFLEEDAIQLLLSRLCPFVSLITPNMPEASVLTKIHISSEEDILQAALRLKELCGTHVLLKGGHDKGAESRDLFLNSTEIEWLSAPRSTKRVHGTGCVLSSAIASGLALGHTMLDAVHSAKSFVTEMIEAAVPLGHGQEIFQFT